MVALAAVLALSGCLGGGKVPAQLLNLTPTANAAAGAAASGTSESALAVVDITAPEKIDVARVPVVMNGSSLAYLKDAQWVERSVRAMVRSGRCERQTSRLHHAREHVVLRRRGYRAQ